MIKIKIFIFIGDNLVNDFCFIKGKLRLKYFDYIFVNLKIIVIIIRFLKS